MADTKDYERYVTKEFYWQQKYEEEQRRNDEREKIDDRFQQILEMVDSNRKRSERLEQEVKASNEKLSQSINNLTGQLSDNRDRINTTDSNMQQFTKRMSPKEKQQQFFRLGGLLITGLTGTGGLLWFFGKIFFG